MPTAAAGPCDLAEGPDGALWGEDFLKNIIFRLDPQSGHIEEYPIPFTTSLSATPIQISGIAKTLLDRTSLSCAIRAGADGNMYAGNGLRNQLVRINPTTKKIDLFQATSSNPLGNGFPFNDLWTSKDGMWVTQTTGNTFAFFNYTSEVLTEHEVPTLASLPVGVYVGSDSIVYMTEFVNNAILTYDPATNQANEYVLPVPAQIPGAVRGERDGYVYFSLVSGNGIGRMNMVTHQFDLYHTNQPGLVGAEVTIDGEGAVWLSSFTANVLARLDPITFTFSYVALPNTSAQLGLPGLLGSIPPYVDVAVNYGPGNALWFSSLTENIVGRYSLS
jgi:streptogramin lyase